MPTLPVIADTYRCTFNWSHVAGVSPRNVIHVRGSGRTAASVGLAVVAALQPHQFEGMPQNFTLDTVETLPLDGISGAISESGGGYNSGSGLSDQ